MIYKKYIQPKDSYFRAGAGFVLYNSQKEVLMFERSDKPGEFQLPQGGLDAGEDARTGALRELFEETAINKDNLKDIYELPGFFTYEYPQEHAIGETYRGQTQVWFAAQLKDGVIVDIEKAEDKEFVSYKWVAIEDISEQVIVFKQEMYRNIMSIVAQLL